MEGTPRQAKFATRFLAYSKQPEKCEQLMEVCIFNPLCRHHVVEKGKERRADDLRM